MRILHIATRHRRGGAERNLIHTALWEARHGHEVHVAVGRDSIPGEMPAGIAVHVVPSLVRPVSPVQDLLAYRALRRLVIDGRYDLVHTHQSKAGILGRLAARGTARLLVHTLHMASFGPAYGGAASTAFILAERLCARWTDVIVSVGEELRRRNLAAGIGRPDQYRIIRSPVEVAAFAELRHLSGPERTAARRTLGLGESGRVAIAVSSLEPRKRVGLVIRQLAPLLRAGTLTLAVAGDGPHRSRLVEEATRLGVLERVRFLGHVTAVPVLFAAADVLVHAATVEGVPQVTVQALAAGVPVVATDMIGLREVPGASIRVVPRSGDGLREAVESVFDEPPSETPVEAFEDWTTDGVDRSLAALHDHLGVVLTPAPSENSR